MILFRQINRSDSIPDADGETHNNMDSRFRGNDTLLEYYISGLICGKHDIFCIFLLAVLLALFAFCHYDSKAFATDEPSSIYYIRLDQKSRNGIYENDALTMVPAGEDYRSLSFKRIVVKGSIQAASKSDPLTSAKHDAFERLLAAEGTTSIRSVSDKDTKSTNEENVISYEGYIRTPYTIIKEGYSKDGTLYEIDMEIDFAPMAYPPEWPYRFFKKAFNDSIAYILSLFM